MHVEEMSLGFGDWPKLDAAIMVGMTSRQAAALCEAVGVSTLSGAVEELVLRGLRGVELTAGV